MPTAQSLCLIAMVLLTSSVRAAASESISFDGAWWSDATSPERVSFVQGVTEGILSVETKTGAGSVKRFTHTFKYYEDRVTSFYATHPEANSAFASDIVYCYGDGVMANDCLSNVRRRSHALVP
jgi:hypothetical protein